MLGRPLIEVVGSLSAARARAAVAAAFTAFALAADQYQFVDDDFGLVLLLPGFFVVPGIVVQAAFNVNRAALLQVLARDFGGAPEGLNVVPLRLILPVTVFVFNRRAGGQREISDRHAAGGVLHFRVLTQVAKQDNFVDASCHEKCSYVRWNVPRTAKNIRKPRAARSRPTINVRDEIRTAAGARAD